MPVLKRLTFNMHFNNDINRNNITIETNQASPNIKRFIPCIMILLLSPQQRHLLRFAPRNLVSNGFNECMEA